MNCEYCGREAVYKCNVCGRLICEEHVKLRTVCTSCIKKEVLNYTIDKATLDKEREKIREIVHRFWGEEEQLTFDRKFIVSELSAYVAKNLEKTLLDLFLLLKWMMPS